MKTLISAVVVLVMVGMVAPVQGDDNLQAHKVYFDAAITQEIAVCQAKSELRTSRSPKLRMKGHREASKALFLETHKAELVESLVALKVEAKSYKVQRFLNDRFSCTCYAQWTPPGNL